MSVSLPRQGAHEKNEKLPKILKLCQKLEASQNSGRTKIHNHVFCAIVAAPTPITDFQALSSKYTF